MQVKKIIVVGGGPAGMLAAIRAAQLKQDVTLVEKNSSLGKKLILSGKGRSNLTNACGMESFLERFSGNGQFLRDSFLKFFNRDLMEFFQARGLSLKIERQMRVFPLSGRADSVLRILEKALRDNKVKVIFKTALKDILVKDSRIKAILLNEDRIIPAERLVLATGGLSYKFTGSNGEGLGLAKKLGHEIITPRAGLVPLETKPKYPALKDLTLKNIRLKFIPHLKAGAGLSGSSRKIVSDIGELTFTDFGISGALVLSISGKIVDWLAEDKSVDVEIDLKPALTIEQLDHRLLRELKSNANKTIKNTLANLLPKKLIDVFLGLAKIMPDKKSNQISLKERKVMVNLLKNLRLDIVRPRPIDEAMITRGGVSLKEINPRTMESRIIPGLYFAGEMIDLDADTGGFNLQAAFSTGYLAGESASLN